MVRCKAKLARLRLAQQQKQDELESQLHEAEREAERRRQETERRRQDMEQQLRESALSHKVERLELEAELIQRGKDEVSEGGRVRGGGGDSRVQSSVAAKRRPSSGNPVPQPLSCGNGECRQLHQPQRWKQSSFT